MALFLVYSYCVQTPRDLGRRAGEPGHRDQGRGCRGRQKQNFENTDVGLEPRRRRITTWTASRTSRCPGRVRPDEPVGIVGAPEGPPQTIPPPPGFGGGQGGGVDSAVTGAGNVRRPGGFMGGRNLPGMAFAGRSGATRQKMVAEGGGNTRHRGGRRQGPAVAHAPAEERWPLDYS